MTFDAAIIGGGAAGMAAAIWCADLKLSAVLLEREREFGGQLRRVYNPIENYPGASAVADGGELRDRFVRQIENFSFTRRLRTAVKTIDAEKNIIETDAGESISARAFVIATGVRRRKLNIAGESELRNRGILESGKLDQKKAAGKTAFIVGGGDAALENALILAETARRVVVVHRRAEFRARAEFLKAAEADPRIEFLIETTVEKIIGGEKVEAVAVKNSRSGKIENLSADAVLIRIGVEPNTEFLRERLALDANGYIVVNHLGKTSAKNVWAIGDVANPVSPTVSTAVGTGATAAKAIYEFLSA